MSDTKAFIKENIISYYEECQTDKYGQVGCISARTLFGDRLDEVMEYIKIDPIICICLYGGRLGTYYGINTYDIKDEDLRRECNQALRNNDSYKYAMTR